MKHRHRIVSRCLYAIDSGEGMSLTNLASRSFLDKYDADMMIYVDSEGEVTHYAPERGFHPTINLSARDIEETINGGS